MKDNRSHNIPWTCLRCKVLSDHWGFWVKDHFSISKSIARSWLIFIPLPWRDTSLLLRWNNFALNVSGCTDCFLLLFQKAVLQSKHIPFFLYRQQTLISNDLVYTNSGMKLFNTKGLIRLSQVWAKRKERKKPWKYIKMKYFYSTELVKCRRDDK